MGSSTERDREIERAMRAHPAGRALRGRRAGRGAGGAGRAASGVVTGAPPVRPAPVPGPAGSPPLRLTARGRVVVAVLALAAATGGVAATGLLSGSAPGSQLHLEGQDSVVVRPGDTLWSLASAVAGEDDVRDVVARIQRVNGLHGTALVPGEVLRLP